MKTDVASVSLSLSGYFIGLASGQLFYGPLLDRFGRKKPLYFGLSLYILATLACTTATSIESLVVLRFFQALGGCSAGVAAMAMVRDIFTPRESAKVLALLILVLGASPLLAPSVGGLLSSAFGWQSVFVALAIMATTLLTVVIFFLPESHQPDVTRSLSPVPIAKNYLMILREPQFYTYAFTSSLAFSVLFVYLASSPTMYMQIFQVSEQVYGIIFGLVAAGFICTSQLNVMLLKRYSNEQILHFGIYSLLFLSLTFVIGSYFGWFGFISTTALLFLMLSCMGLANPNIVALAMAPFAQNAGSAAALMGFLQMSFGALVSVAVGSLKLQQLFPISIVFASSSGLALTVLLLGSRRIRNRVQAAESAEGEIVAAH